MYEVVVPGTGTGSRASKHRTVLNAVVRTQGFIIQPLYTEYVQVAFKSINPSISLIPFVCLSVRWSS
jgi:hypothetical protein